MRPNKYYFIFTSVLFFFSIIWGFLLANIFPSIVPLILEQLRDKFEVISNAKDIVVFLYIFLNNSFIDFLFIILFFLFGLAPIYFLFSNGLVIGIVLSASLQKASPLAVACALLPHGILEIPAFIIASSYGLWLSVKLVKKIFRHEPFKPYFKQALKIFFLIILPLNLLAAFIETYITPLVYSSLK